METAQRSLTDQFQQVQRRAQQLMESMNIPGVRQWYSCKTLLANGDRCGSGLHMLPGRPIYGVAPDAVIQIVTCHPPLVPQLCS